MGVQIHSSSVVYPGAIIEEDVTIGPFCIVDSSSKIGKGTKLRSHIVIGPDTELGQYNDVYPHCSLGMDPQDLKYKGSKTYLRIGNNNIIREGCTMHRGTEHGGGITTIGDNSLFMTGSHIAHDCHVGSNNIMANCTTLAGHVEIGDFCNMGAFSAVHQFCRVGSYAFMGGFTAVSLDALPYMKTVGTRNVKCYGVNTIGLRRHNLGEQNIEGLNKAYRILFHSNLLREQAIAQLEAELGNIPEVNYLIQFIHNSKRGIHRG